MTDPALVELRLLGRFAALREGVEIPPSAFTGRKVRSLVKVLASRQGRFVSNDVLAEALWPDRLPADPVANLQVLVNRARHALGDPRLISTGQGGYALADPPACTVDAERFLALVNRRPFTAADVRDALALWFGDPLPEEAYDDWAAPYRATLFRSHQQALELGAALAAQEGDLDTAVELASRAVESDPLREVAVLALIDAHVAAGDGAAALTVYDDHRRALADALGVEPSPEAAAVHERLLRRAPDPSSKAPGRRIRHLDEVAFVGREEERDLLRAALAPGAGQDEHGVVVALVGPSGSGKSRLLDVVARDVAMVRSRSYLPERSEPWTLLRSLLREVVAQDIGHLEGLPAPMASAVAWLLPELGGPRGPVLDPESRRLLVLEASLRMLEAADRVVAVDDLQWCDPSSLTVLEAASLRVRTLRLVVAFRPDELAAGSEVAGFLDRARVDRRVELDALPRDSLGGLVDDAAVADALGRHTDRSPIAVTEVLRALAAEGLITPLGDGRWHGAHEEAAGRAAALAREGQRRAILARVAAQDAEDRDLLSVLSLLAHEAGITILADACGAPEPDVLESLSRLFRHGLVRLGEQGWATSHDLVTDVVAASLDTADRTRLHADVARALRPSGDPVLLAQHLRAAGDSARAADAFADGARRALDSCADEEAAELAEVGLALASTDPAVARLYEIRGEARHRLGDLVGARDDLRRALGAHPSGPPRATILARLALLSSGADDLLRAAQLAELAIVEAAEDAPARARALEVASVLDMNLGRQARSAERASEALALFERSGDANGRARILDARAMAQFLDGDVRGGGAALRRAADLFEDSGDLVRVVTPRSTGAHALVFAGDAERGLVQATAALDLARTLGHPEGQAYALWHRAEALAALARGEEAGADAAEALTIATRIGHRGWTATAWRAVGLAAEQRDDLPEALRAFRRSLDASENLGLFACWAAARAAMALVALGAPQQAVPLADRALREGPPLGHYEARWAQVEVAAALADPSTVQLAREALHLLRAGGVRQGRERLESWAHLSDTGEGAG